MNKQVICFSFVGLFFKSKIHSDLTLVDFRFLIDCTKAILSESTVREDGNRQATTKDQNNNTVSSNGMQITN